MPRSPDDRGAELERFDVQLQHLRAHHPVTLNLAVVGVVALILAVAFTLSLLVRPL
jgi:hypothetical protein